MEQLEVLRFVSWNVRGVENKSYSTPKLLSISEVLTSENAEIAFLQEMRIGSINYRALLDHAVRWKCFFTVYDCKSKGVAILIKNGVSFKYICHDEDYSGGYLVLFCYIDNELFTLVNVYNHKHDKDILKDYLKETAEGVLVVGGDFNTVLDCTFDQKSMTAELTHRTLKDVFEKFTYTFNLMDTWVHKHPTTYKAYTRSQNDSFSRLDMFLVPEDILERVCNVKISETNIGNISDHKPVVLSLTLRKDSRKKMPNVASKLKKYTYSRDKKEMINRVGMINGAEILSVINSMIDSDQPHPDSISMQSYKKHRCPFTETLKIAFNNLLYRQQIPNPFKKTKDVAGTRKIFNVNYLIFAMIVAKRLSMLLVCPKKNSHPNTDCYIATFSKKPVKIKWAFLKEILSNLCENWKSTKAEKQERDFKILEALGFPKDFWVLDYILPKVSSTKGDIRELQEGCPLTRSLLSLILRYLQIHIDSNDYDTHICHFRQVVVIHKRNTTQGPPEGLSILANFKENGTELKISQMEES